MHLFDNTRIAAFESSPRYYYWRHIRHLVPNFSKGVSPWFITGSAWHAAMDVIWARAADSKTSDTDLFFEAWTAYCNYWQNAGGTPIEAMDPEELTELGPRSPTHVQEVLLSYIENSRPLLKTLEIIAIEQPFVVPLSGSEANKNFYIGRIDKVFRRSDRRLGGADHKTTTAYQGKGSEISFKPSWVSSWSGNPQIDGYLFAVHCLYQEDPFFWIDGVLLHKGIIDRFTRIPLERRFEMLDSWLWRTNYHVQVIQQHTKVLYGLREAGTASELKVLPCFPCGRHCSTFSSCPYRDLCRARANPESYHPEEEPPIGYTKQEWSPLLVDERLISKETLDTAMENPVQKAE